MSNFIHPHWQSYLSQLKDINLDNFLQNSIIKKTMYPLCVEWAKPRLEYLESRVEQKELKRLLKIPLVCGAQITNDKYQTDDNTISHLYHIKFWEEKTANKIQDVKSIIEWGGGYGNLCRIIRMINTDCEYTIFDFEQICKIQNSYITCFYICNGVSILKAKSIKLKFIDNEYFKCNDFNCDLFISTWALNESSLDAVKCVIGNLDTNKFLLTYYKGEMFEESATLIESGLSNCTRYDCLGLPCNYYLVR
jgi:hypothetical protein